MIFLHFYLMVSNFSYTMLRIFELTNTFVHQMNNEIDALTFLYSQMQKSKDNEEFLNMMNDSAKE